MIAGAVLLFAAPAASAAPGTISGEVTRDNGGDPIFGACVRAIHFGGTHSTVETTTNLFGEYTLNVEAANRWGVQFYTCPNTPGHSFVSEFWEDSRSLYGAEEIDVTSGTVTGIDAALADGGSIAGVVTGPGGTPVENACVTAYNTDGNILENLPVAKTDADGEYRIGGLLGDYVVAFDAGFEGCAPGLLGEYYDNTRDYEAATTLTMTDATHLFGANGIDAQLEQAASITGVVTDHTGAPIEGACVSVDLEGEGDGGGFDETDATGRYEIGGLVPGDYTLQFSPCGQTTDLGEFWQNKPDRDSADVITLVAGSQPTEYSAQLQEPTSLTGSVTDPNGDPVENVCVALFDASTDDHIGSATTGADGTYLLEQDDFDDLEGSQVLLQFDPTCQGPSMLLEEWYDDQPDLQSATPIDVPGGAITGIDAQLAEGEGISGVVEDPEGNPISGICVLLDIPGAGSQYFDTTDGVGAYSAGPLAPGSYLVRFVPCNGGGWLPEYFDDSPNRRGATPVVVTDSASAVADATLEQGGSIAGAVTDSEGQPLSNICVTLRKSGSGARVEPGGFAQTGGDGTYLIESLPTGNYDVRFAPCYSSSGTPNYQTEFYEDARTAEAADPVSVTAGETTDEIDAALEEGATISGALTAEGETGTEPVDGVCVAVSSTDGRFFTDVVTNSNGEYLVTGLAPGEYFLRFNTCGSGEYLQEYWQDAHTRADATPFVVAAGSNTANAVLERGGSISGSVTGPGGAPAAGVCVDLRDAQTGEYLLGEVETDAEGEYTVHRVPAGEVKVRFSTCGGGSYIAEYYDDAKRLYTATPVTVVEGQNTPSINASLAQAASISGTVTDTEGNPAGGVCVTAVRPGEDAFDGRSTGTDGEGRYRIGGLDAGEYKLRFSDCGAGLATEWWNDKPSRATADPIALGAGQDVVDRNAELTARPTGAIQGSVSDPDGGDSSDACVTVYDASGEVVAGNNVQDGGYRVSGLPAGSYKVAFVGCGAVNLATEFWAGAASDGVRTPDEAVAIQLADGETKSGIDAEMEIGARITGRVTGPEGKPLSGGCVTVYGAQDSDFAFAGAELRPDGSYVAIGLAPGDYKVQFDPECFGGSSRLASEYYDNAGSFETAEVIEVGAAGTTVAEIDAQLAARPPAAVAVSSGPSGQTTQRRPTFGFSAPADADVECSIDTGTPQWGPCSAPDSHTPSADLAPGSYTFRVRATTDWDQTVATRAFTVAGQTNPPVDGTAPKVEFTGGPKGKVRKRKATFRFSANEQGVSYECSVDGKAFKPCTSPVKLKRLRPGKHSFAVRATDAAGNKSAVVERKFKVVKKKRKQR